jgi:hypothetical protein
MVRLKLAFQIPEFLPMWGKKARVYYHGIPPFCVSCYELGHVKNSCKSGTISWRDYIHRLTDTGISKELFGSWLNCNLSAVETTQHPQPSFGNRSKNSNSANESITPAQLLEFFKKFQSSTPNHTPTSQKSQNSNSSSNKPRSNLNSNSSAKSNSGKKEPDNVKNRNRGRGRGRGRGQSSEKTDQEPRNNRGRGRAQ